VITSGQRGLDSLLRKMFKSVKYLHYRKERRNYEEFEKNCGCRTGSMCSGGEMASASQAAEFVKAYAAAPGWVPEPSHVVMVCDDPGQPTASMQCH